MIFGKCRVGSAFMLAPLTVRGGFLVAQHLAVDLAGRRPRQVRDESDQRADIRAGSAACARTSWMSPIAAASVAWPAAGTMNAFTTWPRNASGTPITAAACTAGCRSSASSISTALMVQPAEMMTSSARPAW